MAKSLDDKLRRFIAQHIASVEQLEILLLLADDSNRVWTVEDVFKIIQSNSESILNRLKLMQATGLLEVEGKEGYRYKPATQDLAESVMALEHTYKTSRVKIIEAIFLEPANPAKHFADSFRIKKEK